MEDRDGVEEADEDESDSQPSSSGMIHSSESVVLALSHGVVRLRQTLWWMLSIFSTWPGKMPW